MMRNNNMTSREPFTEHLQDLDRELELLRKKRQMMEQRQQMLADERKLERQQPYNRQESGPSQKYNDDYSFCNYYDERHNDNFTRPGKRPSSDQHWQTNVPNKRFAGSQGRFQSSKQRVPDSSRGQRNNKNETVPTPLLGINLGPKNPKSAPNKPYYTIHGPTQPYAPRVLHNDFKSNKIIKPKPALAPNKLHTYTGNEANRLVTAASNSVKKVKAARIDNVYQAGKEPTKQMVGRMELALGAILKELKEKFKGTPLCIIKCPHSQRFVKQNIRERIRSVMVGKPIDKADDIIKAYRAQFPKETDKEIVEFSMDCLHAKIAPIEASQNPVKLKPTVEPQKYFEKNIRRLLKNRLDVMFGKLKTIYEEEYNSYENIPFSEDRNKSNETVDANADLKNASSNDLDSSVLIIEDSKNDKANIIVIEDDENLDDKRDRDQGKVTETTESKHDENLKVSEVTESKHDEDLKVSEVTESKHDEDLKVSEVTESNHDEVLKRSGVTESKHDEDLKVSEVTESNHDEDLKVSEVTESKRDENLKENKTASVSNEEKKTPEYYDKIMDKLIAQKLPEQLTKIKHHIAELLCHDHIFRFNRAFIIMTTKNKLGLLAENIDVTPTERKVKTKPEVKPPREPPVVIPYFVRITGKPYLPKKKIMKEFLAQFNPKSIKTPKNLPQLLYVGFLEKENYEKILAANNVVIGNSRLLIRISEKVKQTHINIDKDKSQENTAMENNATEKNNENTSKNVIEDTSGDSDLINPEMDEKITELIFAIRKEQEERENQTECQTSEEKHDKIENYVQDDENLRIDNNYDGENNPDITTETPVDKNIKEQNNIEIDLTEDDSKEQVETVQTQDDKMNSDDKNTDNIKDNTQHEVEANKADTKM